MALTTAPIKSPPATVCDWAELKALSDPRGQVRLNDLRRLWDTNRESEDTDPEGLTAKEEDTDRDAVSGGDEDRFFDSIEGEIGARIEALGDCYPFRISHGSRLGVVGPPTDGGFMYLFCLFLSYANGKELLEARGFPALTTACGTCSKPVRRSLPQHMWVAALSRSAGQDRPENRS